MNDFIKVIGSRGASFVRISTIACVSEHNGSATIFCVGGSVVDVIASPAEVMEQIKVAKEGNQVKKNA